MRRVLAGRRGGHPTVAVRVALACAVTLALTAAGCASGGRAGHDPRATVRLYTSYSQPEVDAVLAAYRAARPGTQLTVFRAPTGQLDARIATERRSGGVRADVLLLSDPLSMQQYAAQRLLRRWSPPEAGAVPVESKSDSFWGVTTSDVVVVHRPGAGPRGWQELTEPRYRGQVAIPDPNFAGSAFGALGFFALAPGFGLDYYRRLKANGAVQVPSPGDVITGVAQGRFQVGMTLDFLARAATATGSPVQQSAPLPGGVRLYAPVAVFAASPHPSSAEDFAGFLLTKAAQQALARLDRHPIRSDVPPRAQAGIEVAPDWPTVFARQQELRDAYRGIFGG